MGCNEKNKVLIVCMDGKLRKQLCDGLSKQGYVCTAAVDGEGALCVIKQQEVDVVLASNDMHGMSGLQLCRTVARIHPHVPVIMISAKPDSGQIAQALACGACDMVSEHSSALDIHDVIVRNQERRAAAARRVVNDRAEILFKAIRAVTAAIDAKSHYAARHSSRVTQLSLSIGSRLGMSQQQLVTLELAAQLHDVGKIGTPDSVLTKPDTLTDDEWVDVLKHPALGGTFLACVPELCEIASIVRHHHEHFAGNGYPDGLQGNAIPLMSRIIAVADAYDAMTSERPYRPAMGHEEASAELMRHSGTQFDGEVVEHLLAALDNRTSERRVA